MEKGRWLVRLAHGKEVLVRAECLESWAHMRPMPPMFQRSQNLSIRACTQDVLVEAPWPLPPEKGTNARDTPKREACEKKRFANCNGSLNLGESILNQYYRTTLAFLLIPERPRLNT